MDIGVTLRNMGAESTAEIMRDCTRAAEDAGMESVWITDHIAIPPDDAEGSGGRYTDPLTTLAWLAGSTSRIRLGAGVLIVPYRPALPTAKAVATVQELSNHRLLLGVGVGWMQPEFDALGVDRHQRGRITDETLDFLDRAFAEDEVELNGQRFLFKPRPPKPPILVGGAPPHALERAIRFGDGWLPMARDPQQLAPAIAEYRRRLDAEGKAGSISVMTGLPLQNPGAAKDTLHAWQALGIDRLICAMRYTDTAGYARNLAALEAAMH